MSKESAESKVSRMKGIWEDCKRVYAFDQQCVKRTMLGNMPQYWMTPAECVLAPELACCPVGWSCKKPWDVQFKFGDLRFGSVNGQGEVLDDKYLIESARGLPHNFWRYLQWWHDDVKSRSSVEPFMDTFIEECLVDYSAKP